MILTFRFATIGDAMIYFNWANNSLVRNFSYNKKPISLSDHLKWFEKKLGSPKHFFYLFETEAKKPVGQVRYEIGDDGVAVIGISVDEKYRGNKFASKMLILACEDFQKNNPSVPIHAYIMKENVASYKSFINAGFVLFKETLFKENESYVLIKNAQ